MLKTETTPVATAVLVERARLAQLWADVRQPDGSLDPEALARFERALEGPGVHR